MQVGSLRDEELHMKALVTDSAFVTGLLIVMKELVTSAIIIFIVFMSIVGLVNLVDVAISAVGCKP
jgi:hypothetical protein